MFLYSDLWQKRDRLYKFFNILVGKIIARFITNFDFLVLVDEVTKIPKCYVIVYLP